MRLALSWGIQASHEMPHPIYPVSFETPFTATLSGLFCTTKPLVREKIDFLNYEVKDPRNGAVLSTVNAEVSKQGAEIALNQISNLANKASFEIQQSLIKEANLAMKVFHAAAEQFLDSLIRSKESKWEFGRLGRSYRDEIWPDEFQSIDTNNAKIAGVSRAIQNLQKLIAQA